jgi:hypothetical protein
MMLRDLRPELVGTIADGVLYFDCPFPACQQSPHGPHSVRVAISAAPFHERQPRPTEHGNKDGKVKVWQASGVFPDTLTLAPSVNLVDDEGQTICWHGFITNGAVT